MPIGFQGIDANDGPLGWGCLTGAKYEQTATLLRQGYAPNAPILNPDGSVPEGQVEEPHIIGTHPITGEPIRDWTEVNVPVDNPSTPDIIESKKFTFECQARSIITGGLNSQGTTERWTSKGTYENVDFVELQVPGHVTITKRDRVSNITNSSGQVVWREEEFGLFTPTVFDVLGAAPSLDPFGSLVEWFILLRRSEDQGVRETSG